MRYSSARRRLASHRLHRRGFTLVELLVVIAILGSLVAIMLPAIQSAREASRRVQCQNHLRQLAIAALNFESGSRQFPPGVRQVLFAAAPIYRGSSLFVHLLPQLEQGTLQKTWDFSDPMHNTLGGVSARTATVLPVLICPSDLLDQNPVLQNGVYYGLTSYGGNGGTRSYFPSQAAVDGVFHTTDSASEPNPGQRPVRMRDIADGASKTLLLGERRHNDPNFGPRLGRLVENLGIVGTIGRPQGHRSCDDERLSADQLPAPLRCRIDRQRVAAGQ